MNAKEELVTFTNSVQRVTEPLPVSSFLGVWLALAASGRLTSESTLYSDELLETCPDSIRAAVGIWGASNPFSTASKVTQGPIPSPEELNTWVNDNSLDLIKSLDIDLPDGVNTQLVVSVIAAITEWPRPLQPIRMQTFMGENYSGSIEKGVLVPGNEHFIAPFKDENGDIFVLTRLVGTNGVIVLQVLGPKSWSPEYSVKIARSIACGDEYIPVEWGEAVESLDEVIISKGTKETVRSFTPAWEVRSTFDVDPNKLAVGDADLSMVGSMKQVAYAKLDSCGFKAAGVTGLYRSGMSEPKYDVVTVRYSRPFSFAATVRTSNKWNNLPLFEGFITEDKFVESS
jgi:hypothetical protein